MTKPVTKNEGQALLEYLLLVGLSMTLAGLMIAGLVSSVGSVVQGFITQLQLDLQTGRFNHSDWSS